MSILRNKIKDKFVQVPNELVTDITISIPARLIYVYLASKPDGWIVRNDEVKKSVGIKDNAAIAKYWRELESAGWITRKKVTTGENAGTYDYVLNENPQNEETPKLGKNPNKGNSQIREIPKLGKNHNHNNTDQNNNTDLLSNTDFNSNNSPIYTSPQEQPQTEPDDLFIEDNYDDLPECLRPSPEEIAARKLQRQREAQEKKQQPVFTDTISELKHRINVLYRRRETTAWDEKETALLKKVSKRNGVLDEMAEIEKLYNAGYEYARRDIRTLLNNWTTELDRACNRTPRRTMGF